MMRSSRSGIGQALLRSGLQTQQQLMQAEATVWGTLRPLLTTLLLLARATMQQQLQQPRRQ
jgi:hypothetical protein